MCCCAARYVFNSVWCDFLTYSFPLPPSPPSHCARLDADPCSPNTLCTLKYYPTHLLNNALVVSPVQSLFIFRTRCLCFYIFHHEIYIFLFSLHSTLTCRRNYFRPACRTGGRTLNILRTHCMIIFHCTLCVLSIFFPKLSEHEELFFFFACNEEGQS